jgi:hypothetical protein
MSDTPLLPEVGSEAFWNLYDEFLSKELIGLSNGKPGDLCSKLQEVLKKGHSEIVRLARTEKGWHYPKAWIVLRGEHVMNMEGTHVFMTLEPGDVMTREFGWDRDVFVTHSPIIERVSGQFLGQQWPNAEKGLFLPLYDKETIMMAIRVKAEKNLSRTLEKAEEEARDWQWY